jgi:phosphoglycolate phosphatase
MEETPHPHADWHDLLPGVQAVIFDLDGTLVDTLGDFTAALNAMRHDLGQAPLAAAAVRELIGKGSEHLIRSVLALDVPAAQAESGQDAIFLEANYERAWAGYQDHYRRINGQFSSLYPHALACLQAVHQRGLPMACVTNKPGEFANGLLAQTGLASYFSWVWGGDAFAVKKPNPLPLLKACEALGVAPAQVLMVGDSSNDAEAARAAGCPVLLLSHGYNHGQSVHLSDADAVLDGLDALAQAFEALAPRPATARNPHASHQDAARG